MGKLDERVIAVTGAAGGIGAATVARLARDGARVLAVDRWSALADPGAPPSDGVLRLEADVLDPAALDQAVATAMDRFGRMDGAFLNAGIARGGGLFTAEDTDWDAIIGVNLTGVFNSARAFARPMVDAGNGGSIVITSSISGLKAVGRFLAYAASKHGVVGIMRSLAQELGPHWIRVNSVHPTSVRTPMIDNDEHARRMVGRPDATVEDLKKLYIQRHALPVAWVEPDEIANAVAWLMSDEARFVTGNTLTVDAGATIM